MSSRLSLTALLLLGLPAAFPARAADPPPVSVYAADPAITGAAMSPNGKRVAYITLNAGRRVVVVLDTEGALTPVIQEGKTEVSGVDWLDDQHLLIIASGLIEGNDLLPKQQLNQGIIYNLATRKTVIALDKTPDTLPIIARGYTKNQRYKDKPTLMVVGLRSGPAFALYAVDLDTGRGALVDPGSLDANDWTTAPDGTVVAKSTYVPAAKAWALFGRQGGALKRIRQETTDRPPALRGLGRTPDRLLISVGWEFTELLLADGSPVSPPVSVGPAANPVFNTRTGLLDGYVVPGPGLELRPLAPALAAAWEKTRRAFKDSRVNFVDHDADYSNLIVHAEAARDAGAYYWVDLVAGKAYLLEKERDLKPEQIGPVRTVAYRSRDGVKLSGVLTLPPGREPRALPLVVWAPASPSDLTLAGFHEIEQMFASRGYAVFTPNVRGSAAGSPETEKAGDGQLGRGMQTDISDGVAELARQGVVDPKRVCIGGLGFGGYAALLGVTVQSRLYRCAVAIDAITDLPVMLSSPDSETRGGPWTRVRRMQRYLGTDRAHDAAVMAVSPLAQAGKANAPVLLIAGERDDDSVIAQSRKMEGALKAAGKPVERVVIKGMAFSPTQPAQREQIYDAALRFMIKYNSPMP